MRIKGFTLLELIITLALAALIALISMTSSSHLKEKNEQTVIINELKAAILYAKVQAISKGTVVSLSPLDADADWSKGMLLTQLNYKTKQRDILYQWQWQHPRWNIEWKGTQPAKRIDFSNNPVNAMSNGRFTLTSMNSKEQTVLILNKLGRLRLGSKD